MPRNRIIRYDPRLKEVARALRKNPTFGEKVLWQAIRRKQLGYEFHRQVSIDRYVVDFYCHELQLAIEIDGITHATPVARLKDEKRRSRLEKLGGLFAL